MKREIWLDIPGYRGRYQVSNLGRVKSLARRRKSARGGTAPVEERILKQKVDKYGYMVVALSTNKKLHHYTVHRLVALTFFFICGFPFPGATVNHINEDKTDNRPENLEWCTSRYNTTYTSGKPVVQYTVFGRYIQMFPSLGAAADYIGVYHSEIKRVCQNKANICQHYRWEYLRDTV